MFNNMLMLKQAYAFEHVHVFLKIGLLEFSFLVQRLRFRYGQLVTRGNQCPSLFCGFKHWLNYGGPWLLLVNKFFDPLEPEATALAAVHNQSFETILNRKSLPDGGSSIFFLSLHPATWARS
jgi:hypothetical protein